MQKVIRILQLRIFGDEGDGSTSSQEVSHASPFPLPAGERARRTAVTSGLTCSVPFTRSGPIGLLVRTLVASSRWYSPARRLTWDISPLFSERLSLYTANGRNTSWRPSAEILSVKDIPSSRCLFRLAPSVPRTEGTVYGLLPTPMARDYSPRGPNCLQKGLPEIIREMLLPTPTATEIHHRQRVERWKYLGRTSMHGAEDGEKNPNGLTDFLDFHGLPDPDGKGLEGCTDAGELREEGEEPAAGKPSRFLCPNWEKFPTQSPVCGRDDGVPHGLDGITFSSWRQQSVKGYGNAIVPQVIYEIFKAIESTYK